MKLQTAILVILMGGFSSAVTSSFAQQSTKGEVKEVEKIEKSTELLTASGQMKDRIPSQLLSKSRGIVIIPKLINGGFVVGGKRGKGIALVKNNQGQWSDPVFVTITGGSIGAQIGVQAVDLILVFKDSETLLDIEKASFTMGGDVSVAAGPLGRNSTASTDYKLEAEIYSYSRSKGLFAGITLNGAILSIDKKANDAFYTKDKTTKSIFASTYNSSKEVQNLKSSLKSLEK